MLLALGALIAPAGAQAQDCADTGLKPTRANLEQVRSAVLCLHNQERARHGLSPLRENPKLRRAAGRHSANMVSSRFFDHTTPGGATMVDRIRRAGYTSGASAWSIGENIAWGSGRFATAAQIHRSWMNSSGHRANILQRRSARSGSASRPACRCGSRPPSRAPRTPQTSATADRAGPAQVTGRRRRC